MTEVDRKTLAEHLGMTTQGIGKWVKKGTLDKSIVPNTKGKLFYLEIAVKNIQLDKKRDTHNSKSAAASKPKPKKQTPTVPPQIEDDEDLNNTENMQELEILLIDANTPIQRVTIIKDFWTGKINEQKFKKEEGELITLTDAKGVIEVMFTPLSRKLDDIHIDLKNRFPDIPMDSVEWLADYVNDIKKSVSEYEW